ncbi:helix-turn-helix domain-containing protein [Dellaglioa algida]|uniref:HTH cro/C1-type domain-containing protein n=1 Tax=Dellaglioa algida TaxID=105612 RepID=A0A5C6M6J1_9LACO|nr:helix-turn-helix domain-containing protein [Dellaglioa algida]MDK1717516.1 helix-turn-helix domain-containing protein [Dellaglioa algida]MDK1720743.1 helix-turn-helix domain-containing protein [Dellaglioa algida]MDK1722412.1 helix-turn-helix domain-containing protein [Dellaglioa algida]MDK1724082.1 helix-turn-helix domain-containing protein [Dellaglioa algida]MDK1725617.1 helix-turn-helix domain-containing protein [Dellaglioa algida]
MKIIFAEQLVKCRKEKQLSQEELANQLFISRQAISKWETGEAEPDLGKIEAAAKVLDVPVEVLLFGGDASQSESGFKKKIKGLLEEDEADKDWHGNHRWREWQYKPINNGWEFLARYYWVIFGFIGMLVWALART